MLLSSALPCDGRSWSSATPGIPWTNAACGDPEATVMPNSRTTGVHSPVSPTTAASSSLYNTCRALQAMLMSPASPGPTTRSPPRAHLQQQPRLSSPISFKMAGSTRTQVPPSPSPLSSVQEHSTPQQPRKFKVRKDRSRYQGPPRGVNKRRRSSNDNGREHSQHDDGEENVFSTPKRQRMTAPLNIPRGLARSDYEALDAVPDTHLNSLRGSQSSLLEIREPVQATPQDRESPVNWTSEDDRALVQLVLEKFKLSDGDWVDCAKSLGRDTGSIGRRWQSLVGDGSIGLRGSSSHNTFPRRKYPGARASRKSMDGLQFATL